jgi:CDP-diacylglycerol--glycerol-3-phosphate 3-phosphatidyltransferase
MQSPSSASALNLPNGLTLLRCLLTPVCILAIVSATTGWSVAAALVFGAAALTDAFDGLLARSRGQITQIGQVLDPIADKVLICGCLLALVVVGRAPLWAWIAIAVRELVVTALRFAADDRGRIISASKLGKIKMRFQIGAVLTACLVPADWTLVTSSVLALAVVATWWSGLSYVMELRRRPVRAAQRGSP